VQILPRIEKMKFQGALHKDAYFCLILIVVTTNEATSRNETLPYDILLKEARSVSTA
jgi:hypothetical protein